MKEEGICRPKGNHKNGQELAGKHGNSMEGGRGTGKWGIPPKGGEVWGKEKAGGGGSKGQVGVVVAWGGMGR